MVRLRRPEQRRQPRTRGSDAVNRSPWRAASSSQDHRRLGRRPDAAVPEIRWQRLASQATAVAAVGALAISAVSIFYTGESVNATRQQVRLQEQGQVTDRFARAIEQLASAQVTVRLGAIYSLERIMRDSRGDQPTVVSVLGGFVRNQAPNKRPGFDRDRQLWLQEEVERPKQFLTPPTDIQAAVTVLGRRDAEHDGDAIVDLSGADLGGVLMTGDFRQSNLMGVSLRKALLFETRLQGSLMRESDLAGASINGANLRSANLNSARLDSARLFGTDLAGASMARSHGHSARFSQVDLTRSDLTLASLDGATFSATDTTGATLDFADLQRANLIDITNPAITLRCVKIDDKTRLPPEAVRTESGSECVSP